MTPDDPRHPRPGDTDDDARVARDDLASALLDGLLSDEQAAEARRRPDVMARAAAMEAARTALRDAPSPAPSAAARDRAVAAALAAFDEAAGAGDPGAPTVAGRHHDRAGQGGRDVERRDGDGRGDADRGDAGPGGVTDLGARRRAGRQAPPRWLGAAAALILVEGGMIGLAIATSTSSDDNASEMGGVAEDSAEGDHERATADETQSADEAPSAAPESGGGVSGLADGEAGDLGTFPDGAALADRVGGLLGGDEGAAGQDSVAPQPTLPDTDEFDAACTAGHPAPLADPGLVVRLHGRAVVDGRPVEVWVVDTGGGSRLVAIDRTCTVVVDQAVG